MSVDITKPVTAKEVAEYITSWLNIPIGENSVLFTDLPLDGLDLETFMLELSHHFNFKLDNYTPGKYHLSEHELGNIFLTIYRLLFNRKKLRRMSFTIAHLTEVINRGEWFDPVTR